MNEKDIEKHIDQLLAQGIPYEQLSDVEPDFTAQDDFRLQKRLEAVEKSKKRRKKILSVYRAGIAATLLIVISLLIPTETWAKALEFFGIRIETFSSYTSYQAETNTDSMTEDMVQLAQVEVNGIPKGFELVDSTNEELITRYIYEDEEGHFIRVRLTPAEGTSFNIDSEDSEFKVIEKQDVTAHEYVKEDMIQIVWIEKDTLILIQSNENPKVVEEIFLTTIIK